MDLRKNGMPAHYIVKKDEVYHIPSQLRVGVEFPTNLHAKRFVETIPPECDIPDIEHHSDLIDVLRNHRATYKQPPRIIFETTGATQKKNYGVARTIGAVYHGYLDEYPWLETDWYAIVQLNHSTSSSWEKENGYHGQWLCVHMPSLWAIGMGKAVEMKAQIKMWQKERFTHVGKGLFISASQRYKTQSRNRVQIMENK